MVPLGGGQQRAECGHIQPVIAGRVELNLVGCDQEVGRGSLLVGDNLAQPVEGLPQVIAGGGLRRIGPKQSGQSLPAVRAV